MKHIIYTTLIIFSFVSCDNMQTVIDVDLPKHEPKLVVNSVNSVGENWKAYISVSQAPLSTDNFVFLSNATVLLMEGENVIDTLAYNASKHRYESDLIVQQGANFDIRVSHPMYETISSSLYSFERINIKSVEELQMVTNDNVSLKFTFDDPESTNNYYMINLKGYFPEQDNGTDSLWGDYYADKEKIYFDSDDPSLNQLEFSRGKVLFNDVLFDGTTKEINILFSSYFLLEGEGADSIQLNLWSVDYAFYQYFTTKIVQSNTGDNPIFNSEPVNVYNSFLDENEEIKGYGIFAVSSKDSVIIQTE